MDLDGKPLEEKCQAPSLPMAQGIREHWLISLPEPYMEMERHAEHSIKNILQICPS